MKKIFAHNLKSGMSFDQPVYIDNDNIFLERYEPITKTILQELEKWKIKELITEGELIQFIKARDDRLLLSEEENTEVLSVHKTLKKITSEKSEFNSFFESSKNTLGQAYKDIATKKPFDISRVRKISEGIVNYVKENTEYLIHLVHMSHKNNRVQHALVTSFWGALLANYLDFSTPKTIEITYAMLLMDIGMTTVSSSVTDKNETLSSSERRIIEAHTVHGYNYLLNHVRLKNKICLVALQHHENFDGSGYPKKIKLYDIDEYARIASIADSFTTMLEEKPYRKSFTPYFAMKDLVSKNLNRYDPKYIKTFCSAISFYPFGSLVQLSDDSINMVVAPKPNQVMRPTILTLRTKENYKPAKAKIIPLVYHHQFYITKALNPKDVDIHPAKELEAIFDDE